MLCRVRNWHLDSLDGVNAATSNIISGSGFSCGSGLTGILSVVGSTTGTGCTVQVDKTDTAGSSTASVTLTFGSVSAVVGHSAFLWNPWQLTCLHQHVVGASAICLLDPLEQVSTAGCLQCMHSCSILPVSDSDRPFILMSAQDPDEQTLCL